MVYFHQGQHTSWTNLKHSIGSRFGGGSKMLQFQSLFLLKKNNSIFVDLFYLKKNENKIQDILADNLSSARAQLTFIR